MLLWMHISDLLLFDFWDVSMWDLVGMSIWSLLLLLPPGGLIWFSGQLDSCFVWEYGQLDLCLDMGLWPIGFMFWYGIMFYLFIGLLGILLWLMWPQTRMGFDWETRVGYLDVMKGVACNGLPRPTSGWRIIHW
jgi:hypothetical protein